jgi:hypothetical protein
MFGLAVAVHGDVRATKDLDVLIRPESLEDAKNVLTTIGYDLEAGTIAECPATESTERATRESKVLVPSWKFASVVAKFCFTSLW